jgi:hypothetical protein
MSIAFTLGPRTTAIEPLTGSTPIQYAYLTPV